MLDMTRTLRYLLLLVLTGLSVAAFAQGEIAGKVLDDKKEPLISATVQVYQGGILKGGNVTDYDGIYSIKPLEPGYYDVLVTFTGYDSTMVTRVVVQPSGRTTQNFTMSRASKELTTITIKAYKKPLVDQDQPNKRTLTSEEIKTIPTTEVTDLISLAPGQYQAQRGKGVSMGGARANGTLYIIDGVQVQNIGDEANTGVNMSQGSIEQLEVMTSGIPAKYGDVTGGVVSITSRGVAKKMSGNVRLQQSVDGYNNRFASFSIAGPLLKKKVDSVTKKPILGFALSGDYYDDRNRYPTYDKQWVLKDEALNRINANPLRVLSDNSGARIYNYESNYVTFADMEQRKIQPRNRTRDARLNAKVDYQINDNMRIIAGGMGNYVRDDEYSRTLSLMSPGGTVERTDFTTRGFLRFTQKFGKMNDTSTRKSAISNAFYSVQADFQRTATGREDPNFKKNLFNYAYVGKFTALPRNNIYVNTTDSISGRTGVVLLGSSSGGYQFTRDEQNRNPLLANYTSQYYNSLEGVLPTSILQIQSNNAMANGDMPRSTYSYNGSGLFASPGLGLSGHSRFLSDQYALDVNASFDLMAGKTKHAIEFGLYYQQRNIRGYAASINQGGTSSLWSQMRNLVSTVDNQNLRLDRSKPIFRINGREYIFNSSGNVGEGTFVDRQTNQIANVKPSPTDTIFYEYTNIAQSNFDKKLRAKLGKKDNEIINVDELRPEDLSLDMFSADELLNVSGNAFINYYGYSYTGAKQNGAVNFNDFWTQKGADGNFTRPIGAFTPTYIAGYIQDRFDYKDMHFNIGVRVDRYSANTKVLKDPYSLYPVTTLSQVQGATNFVNGGKHPSNVAGDAVVYVSDNASTSPSIIGYRTGNTWYDPTGKVIEDPSILKQYSDGRDPQPLIQTAYKDVKITDSNFNPNLSFTDYNPQVTVMPRIQFSFPISDVANFYAHYDIYAQRPYPNTIGYASAWDFYQMGSGLQQGVVNNANLRSQKTFDYELGFQQKLTDHSALTITAFYKERKDMISIVPYIYAYLGTSSSGYQTYGNRDFSSTKGSTLVYDMRATNNLSMQLSYTLQFAEGTGSNYNSGRGLLTNLIQEGLPNLRYVTYLNVDSRHNMALNANYRYGAGEGPVVKGKNILQNAGANLILRTRSGEPYTRYSDALGQTVIGGVNGARLPWHFSADLRVDKDFALNFSKKNQETVPGVKPKRQHFVKAIVMVNNLFNTREVLGVWGYTGRTDDNGYLVSSFGRQFVPQQISPQSYTDLFRIYANNPGFLNYARTVGLSVEYNF